MKTLKEYIEESILDVDDLVADDTMFIEKWLKENCEIFGSYTINDGIVNVNGSILILPDNKSIDVQFGEVTGGFSCSFCAISSLEGCPKRVGGSFECNNCQRLLSLEGAPKEVGMSFRCKKCIVLRGLKGGPESVGDDFDCRDCTNLKSLQGAPKKVGRTFNCSGCTKLRTLNHAPKNCEIIKPKHIK